MPTERDIALARPEAFDFVFGNLATEAVDDFTAHLAVCPHCQAIVAAYSEIGRIIQELPPHVEPRADLEDRTVAAMLLALAGQPAKADQWPRCLGVRRWGVGRTGPLGNLVGPRGGQVLTAGPLRSRSPGRSRGPSPCHSLARWRRHRRGPVGLWLAAGAALPS